MARERCGYSVIFSLAALSLCLGVLGEYQLEVQLLQYNNSMGRLANGECCDLEGQFENVCHVTEACDVRITFSLSNFHMGVAFHSQTKGIGTYVDTNQINFVNCAELRSTVPTTNPLTFFIVSDQWTGTNLLRLTAEVNDLDMNAQGQSSIQLIGSPFLEIPRPSMPSNTFNTDQAINSGAARLDLRYRVICSDGTCGNDCSQTSNCPTWSRACTNIDPNTPPPTVTSPTSPTNPCIATPCMNGGSCVPVNSQTFRCDCIEGFTGNTCSEVVTGPSMASTTVPMTTQTINIDSTDSYTVSGTDNGTVCFHAGRQWILYLCLIFMFIILL